MAKKRKAIVLSESAEHAGEELKSMVAELLRGKQRAADREKTVVWNRRFSASGKMTPAPKIPRA